VCRLNEIVARNGAIFTWRARRWSNNETRSSAAAEDLVDGVNRSHVLRAVVSSKLCHEQPASSQPSLEQRLAPVGDRAHELRTAPLCRPHDWRCPVIMKLDPEHTGWTCARCGAIAVSADPAIKPA
jgi:hypothetical protein